jgi:dTDP-4-dehydrorhamnose reductase
MSRQLLKVAFYTKDLAQKIKQLLQAEAYELYHNYCSWYEFADKIFELLNLKSNFAPTTTAEFDAKVHRAVYSILVREKRQTRG